MKKFYMVLVEDSNGCTRRHPTIEDAKKEADRVSALDKNIGKGVTIMAAVEYKMPDEEWAEVE